VYAWWKNEPVTGERFNVYLPATLAQRVREARQADQPFDLSAAAAKGIAAELNGHQAAAGGQLPAVETITGRLDEIEHKLSLLVNAMALLLVGVGVLAMSVRSLATS
jgi:hypothetical protein